MRLHGISRDQNPHCEPDSWRYEVRETGYKYNLTDLQSALGLVQLAKCDAMFQARRQIAETYNSAFRSLEALETPPAQPDRESSWHLYVLRLQTGLLRISRDKFIQELAERGVHASVHFIPLHLQPAYQKRYGYSEGDLPVAEREYRRYISLPIYPTMNEAEIQHVISSIAEVVDSFVR